MSFPATTRFYRSTLLLLVIIGTLVTVESWSMFPNSRSNHENLLQEPSTTRRKLFQKTISAALVVGAPSVANAACLQGDLRPVCIGIYKVPIDDNILPYVSTPEKLHEFAPDLKYVPPIEYPKSFESAMAILRAQRTAADEIKQHVFAGRLEEAGIKVLGLIPQVTTSSRRVFYDLQAKIRNKGIVAGNRVDRIPTDSETTVEEMAIELAENQMNIVTGCWGDCDITIGQGIRGELGAVTVAQLTILESVRDASCALDDYLVTATTLSGGSMDS